MSTPRTWVVGEVVTAAMLNTEIRDQFNSIFAGWTPYGSGSSWTASSSNPSLGDGTWLGYHLTVGKSVDVRAQITMGSTTTFGSGTWRIGLPVPAKTSPRQILLVRASRGSAYDGQAVIAGSSTYCELFTHNGGSLSGVTATSPATWASGDYILVHGRFEAA